MTPRAEFWILITVVATGTFLMRSIPIWLHGRRPMPGWLERLLRHVPAAALTALVVPGALYVKTDGVYTFAPERTIAAIAALVVAWRFGNIIATLAVGMGVLWVAQALM